MLDTRQIHPMSDFLRNHKAHVARLKETRTPEVLTVNGRAEVVLLDTETYENMVEQLNHQQEKEIAAARAHMAQAQKNAPPQEPITEAEIERRHAVLDELVAETERLGLYR
jgi:PHD/YefM family antitoxin component YafN of YafNO toxin-antitoxin module